VRYLKESAESGDTMRCSSWWSWGTPAYVDPGSAPPQGGGGPKSMTADIASPEFAADGAVLVKGAQVVFSVPAGVAKYRVWFAPPKPATDGSVLVATPVATDGADAGDVAGAQLAIVPVWQRLGTDASDAGAAKSTVLVTFE